RSWGVLKVFAPWASPSRMNTPSVKVPPVSMLMVTAMPGLLPSVSTNLARDAPQPLRVGGPRRGQPRAGDDGRRRRRRVRRRRRHGHAARHGPVGAGVQAIEAGGDSEDRSRRAQDERSAAKETGELRPGPEAAPRFGIGLAFANHQYVAARLEDRTSQVFEGVGPIVPIVQAARRA